MSKVEKIVRGERDFEREQERSLTEPLVSRIRGEA